MITINIMQPHNDTMENRYLKEEINKEKLVARKFQQDLTFVTRSM